MRCRWGFGWALGAWAMMSFGCGSSAAGGDGGSMEDAPVLPPGVTPSPDGMGYCCPSGGSSGCDCSGLTGGFVLNPAACGRPVCDSPSPLWVPRVGEHGCHFYSIRAPRSDDEVCHFGGAVPDAGPPSVPTRPEVPEVSSTCRALDGLFRAEPGTLHVSPTAEGLVLADGITKSLQRVFADAAEGDVILIEDGTYTLQQSADGTYTGLRITTPNLTVRSASGDPSAVVIDGAYHELGGQGAVLEIDASSVVLADLTLKRSVFDLIHLSSNVHGAALHDLQLLDAGRDFIVSDAPAPEALRGVLVSCSHLSMTAEGRRNIWGEGPVDGSDTCAAGGIDARGASGWHVQDNVFEGIYCDADTPRPVHGARPDLRGTMTYVGGLAGFALRLAGSESGSFENDTVIERNRFIDCAQAIDLLAGDLRERVAVRNNMIFSAHAESPEHGVPLRLELSNETTVDHNSVIFGSAAAYPHAIEYAGARDIPLRIRANLTNASIVGTDAAASTEVSGNSTDGELSWFRDAASGDLHLVSCDILGAGPTTALTGLMEDYDRDPRPEHGQVGVDECVP